MSGVPFMSSNVMFLRGKIVIGGTNDISIKHIYKFVFETVFFFLAQKSHTNILVPPTSAQDV